ncbi:hypothetical protein V6N11_052002 [Hibiscus sabdariffa]|uniref:Uncharacterized protein n=1 Tax=Hibiscus sabdariffa TaxID=183260 RepID=A0ABR2U9H7_9ROSI
MFINHCCDPKVFICSYRLRHRFTKLCMMAKNRGDKSVGPDRFDKLVAEMETLRAQITLLSQIRDIEATQQELADAIRDIASEAQEAISCLKTGF